MKEIMRKPLEVAAKRIVNVAETGVSRTTPWAWFEPKVPKKLLEKQDKDA